MAAPDRSAVEPARHRERHDLRHHVRPPARRDRRRRGLRVRLDRRHGGTGTCTAPAWEAATVYTGGQTVSDGGHTWSAKWWTQGDRPSSADASPWTDQGAC
ncbi:carbohydrate-binding protein [Luteimicrobium album]|uniref:carbohydrate-binding protein n=1 Tax=Luteimicrobium album TaxID=1054550 RepID=UPI003D6720A6